MVEESSDNWLLLIHHIPPKPNTLRVKIWRKLQQMGAVAIKPSVYVMPLSEQSREDLSWTLREIVEGGGDGSISETRFVEGLSDDQIIALFHNARKTDYEKLIQEINAMLNEWPEPKCTPVDSATKGVAQQRKLQRRLEDIVAIDFFQNPERSVAELQLRELENLLSGTPSVGRAPVSEGIGDLKGKAWITRGNLFVDRIACAWLIRRFVDQTAVFKFVPEAHYSHKADEIRFDIFDGEYTHEGDQCTFEVMIKRFQIQDHALKSLSEVVHDIDLKDGKFGRSETDGFNVLLTGLVAAHPDDDQRITEGLRLFDHLYAYYQRQKRE